MSPIVNIHEKDGIITLESDDFDLKIDNNRKIYVKKKDSKIFKSTEQEIPRGYTSDEKKKYLYNLYQMVLQRREELEKMRK